MRSYPLPSEPSARWVPIRGWSTMRGVLLGWDGDRCPPSLPQGRTRGALRTPDPEALRLSRDAQLEGGPGWVLLGAGGCRTWGPQVPADPALLVRHRQHLPGHPCAAFPRRPRRETGPAVGSGASRGGDSAPKRWLSVAFGAWPCTAGSRVQVKSRWCGLWPFPVTQLVNGNGNYSKGENSDYAPTGWLYYC